MNRKTKEVVFETLENNIETRSNDTMLIYRVLQKMLDIDASTPTMKTLTLMKDAGISFESITRWRRQWLEDRPEIRERLKINKYRKELEMEYIEENMNHIPSLY